MGMTKREYLKRVKTVRWCALARKLLNDKHLKNSWGMQTFSINYSKTFTRQQLMNVLKKHGKLP